MGHLVFRDGLQRPAAGIVKDVVQQEDLLHGHAQFVEPAAELVECLSSQPPGQQGTEMLRAQVHFQRPVRVQRKGDERHRADLIADDAVVFLRPGHEGGTFAQGKGFLAIGAVGLANDAVPLAACRLALRTRGEGGNAAFADPTQAVHANRLRLVEIPAWLHGRTECIPFYGVASHC